MHVLTDVFPSVLLASVSQPHHYPPQRILSARDVATRQVASHSFWRAFGWAAGFGVMILSGVGDRQS
jgi:hypothetical protein